MHKTFCAAARNTYPAGFHILPKLIAEDPVAVPKQVTRDLLISRGRRCRVGSLQISSYPVENLALRHQLSILRRSVKLPKLTSADRLLWTWLCEVWSDWRSALVIVKPETVIRWYRKGFRLFRRWKVRHGHPGRPPVSKEIRQLIRKTSRENPLWGAPRIHGDPGD